MEYSQNCSTGHGCSVIFFLHPFSAMIQKDCGGVAAILRRSYITCWWTCYGLQPIVFGRPWVFSDFASFCLFLIFVCQQTCAHLCFKGGGWNTYAGRWQYPSWALKSIAFKRNVIDFTRKVHWFQKRVYWFQQQIYWFSKYFLSFSIDFLSISIDFL